MPRKTEFELNFGNGEKHKSGQMKIVGTRPEDAPYVAIYLKDPTQKQTTTTCWIDDADLERFAVNILKALGSKKILSEQELKFVRTQKTRKRPLK